MSKKEKHVHKGDINQPNYTPPRVLEINGISTIVVDPHNEAFFFWARAYQDRINQGLIDKAQVVRVDRHADNHKTRDKIRGELKTADEKELWRFTKNLWVGSFVEPALEYGIIQKPLVRFNPYGSKDYEKFLVWMGSEGEPYDPNKALEYMQNYSGPTWWDIDLDAFCLLKTHNPRVRGSLESRMDDTKQFLVKMPQPELITIARTQTPRIYAEPNEVDAVEKTTLDMLKELTKPNRPALEEIYVSMYG